MTTTPDLDRFWAVVPAGGAGTRLWPVSRASSPKFLHDLTGSGRTLIQATVDRLRVLAGERVLVVTGAAHADAVREQVPDLPSDLLIAEPSPRDSMAAIGLAAAVLERRDPDAIIGTLELDGGTGVVFIPQHALPDLRRRLLLAQERFTAMSGPVPGKRRKRRPASAR